jgi:hypothetical protein
MARKENTFADGRKMRDNRDALHLLHACLVNQVHEFRELYDYTIVIKIPTEQNFD